MIHGAWRFACSNMSRTRDAPTPTNISTKSEPEILKNGTFASPAIAFASKVLPVPGGPTINTPLGIVAPKRLNFQSTEDWKFFSLFFETLPAHDCVFNMIESENPTEDDFNFYNISLSFSDAIPFRIE